MSGIRQVDRRGSSTPVRGGDRVGAGRLAVLGVAGAIGLSVVLAACNPAASRPEAGSTGSSTAASGSSTGPFTKQPNGSLRISGFNPSDEVGKSRSDYAASQSAGVKVSQDTTNFDPQKFTAQVASGNVPDLIQADRAIIATLADKKLVMPLDQCYSVWGVKPTEQYYPAAIDDLTYQGKVYGIPQFFQASIIIGNDTVLGQHGLKVSDLDTSDPEGLVKAAATMTKKQGNKLTTEGFEGDIPGSAALWLKVFGGGMYDKDGKPTLDTPENEKALTFMKQLSDAQGGYATIKSFKDAQDVFGDNNAYVANQVGAQVWAQWYVNVLTNTKDKVKISGQVIKDNQGKPLGFAGGSAFAIPSKAKNPSAACAWAVNATSTKAWDAAAQARLQTVKEKKGLFTGLFTGSPVADQQIRSAYVKPTGNAGFDQTIETTYAALENTVSTGSSPVGQQASNALSNAVQSALTGSASPSAALKRAQSTAMEAWAQSAAGKGK